MLAENRNGQGSTIIFNDTNLGTISIKSNETLVDEKVNRQEFPQMDNKKIKQIKKASPYTVNECNIDEYKKYKDVFPVDYQNNVYFRYLPYDIASFIYCKLLLNRKFAYCIFSLTAILYIVRRMLKYYFEYITAAYNVSIIYQNLCIAVCCVYIAGMNIQIVELISIHLIFGLKHTMQYYYLSHNL